MPNFKHKLPFWFLKKHFSSKIAYFSNFKRPNLDFNNDYFQHSVLKGLKNARSNSFRPFHDEYRPSHNAKMNQKYPQEQ